MAPAMLPVRSTLGHGGPPTIKPSAFTALLGPAGSVTVQTKLPQAVDHRLFPGLDAPDADYR